MKKVDVIANLSWNAHFYSRCFDEIRALLPTKFVLFFTMMIKFALLLWSFEEIPTSFNEIRVASTICLTKLVFYLRLCLIINVSVCWLCFFVAICLTTRLAEVAFFSQSFDAERVSYRKFSMKLDFFDEICTFCVIIWGNSRFFSAKVWQHRFYFTTIS